MNRTNRKQLQIVGVCFWIVALIGGALWAFVRTAPSRAASQPGLVEFLFGSHHEISAIDPTGTLRADDPVFLRGSSGQWHQVGHVAERAGQPGATIELVWYSDHFDPGQVALVRHENDGSLQSVLALMLPEEKRQQIQRRLSFAFEKHGEELTAAIMPLVDQSLRKSLPLIETELRQSLTRHEDDVEALLKHWNQTLVDRHLVPLARRELLPIVRQHGEPVANDIGRELWNRVSLWSFGWRAVYDRTPLPSQNLVEQEWLRFVEEEAVPVVDKHMDEIVAALQRVVRDVAADSTVRDKMASAADELADDPQTRKLATALLRDSLVENQALYDLWRGVWSSDEAREALSWAGQRLEPVVREIGETLFGSRRGGIDPAFARVLRNQVLGKDRRWIVATPAASREKEPRVVEPAGQPIAFPMIHLAGDV